MQAIEVPRGVNAARTAAPGRRRRAQRPARLLRVLLAGLNRVLSLSDFSRGDIFRD
jgi:hypothetical protein